METVRSLFRIHPDDTVAVAIRALRTDEKLAAGDREITIAEDIPAGHKVALRDIAAGEKIIKYGYPIGGASEPIAEGKRVHTHNCKTLLSEESAYRYDESKARGYAQKPVPAPTIQAYRRENGEIGIRNDIWIVPAVGCVNRTAEALAGWAQRAFAEPDGSGISGVYAWTHPYGCSQMGDDHATTRRILADLVRHPNAGAVLVLALGCENITLDQFKKELGTWDENRVKFLVTQNVPDEIEAGRALLSELASFASRAKREPVSAAELVIGMKCGGSDGFSGITANALVGQVCDAVTAMGGSAILTEVPEMFGAEQILMDRCESREVFDKTVSLIDGFKDYFVSHHQVVYENPSPGNKDGGITTLEDKSLGCVQKGGKAPVRDVLRYGDRVTRKGLQLLEGPGNDIVSTTAMTAAGAHIILFTTGRGTPLGAPVPTVKISSNSALAERKSGWIDFDAGKLFAGEGGRCAEELLKLIFEVASGTRLTKNEQNGYREIAIFKDGVTL
jgi:altronate hydrolase